MVVGIILAVLATTIYYLGVAIFRVAVERLAPLRITRPFHLVWTLLTNWIFLIGLMVVAGGVGLQVFALTLLPLSVAQSLFVPGLGILFLFTVSYLGERLSGREWGAIALIALSALLVVLSVTPDQDRVGTAADPVKVVVIGLATLFVAWVLFGLGSASTSARHARPLAGVAYGFAAGSLIGTAQLCIKGLASVYPELVSRDGGVYFVMGCLAGGTAFLMFTVALQRCPVSIMVAVGTVAANTQLALMGTVLYGERWPADPLWVGLRVAGLVLAVIAMFLFPRHTVTQHTSPAHGRSRAPVTRQ